MAAACPNDPCVCEVVGRTTCIHRTSAMILPDWHPGDEFSEVASDWQKEPNLCKALEMAAKEEHYAIYCGYHRLLLAAKAEIERLRGNPP